MNYRLAQILTYLLHPAVYPVMGALICFQISPARPSSEILFQVLAVIFAGTYILPLLLSYLYYYLGWIQNLEMNVARQRRLPYLTGALCYYGVARIVEPLPLPPEIYLYLMGSTLVILVHLVLLWFIKPSAHLGGMGGFTALLIVLGQHYAFPVLPYVALVILLAGFLGAARLYLRAHRPEELALGYLSGLGIVLIALLWAG